MPTINTSLTTSLTHATDMPWQHTFLPLLREIEAKSPHLPRIGTAARAHQETVQLGQTASLAFAPREIADVTQNDDGYHINLFNLGMLGPQGPLPLHYTEMIKDRVDNHHDTTLNDFINLFHHRALSLHYRAWATSQATAGLDRTDDEQFAQYIWHLSGFNAQQNEDLPSHYYLSNASHFIHRDQNPDALVKTISHYFQVPVKLHAYAFHWLHLSAEDQSRIGKTNSPAHMGVNATMGNAVPDVQQRFYLEIGPLSLSDYIQFLPNGDHINALQRLIKTCIGMDYQWDIALTIQPETIPEAMLGSQIQLGRTAWVNSCQSHLTDSIAGIRFTPNDPALTESTLL